MKFSSLNVDVLLHLIKDLDPDDRFNLVLSGILKGFENANEGIDIRHRYSGHHGPVQTWVPPVLLPNLYYFLKFKSQL